MDIFSANDIEELLFGNTYPGRGIVIGKTPDGKKACTAYFIMGRSENSRNRVFVKKDGQLFTEPFEPSKVSDPSLIIYPALKMYENNLIVTNGDHTDTVYKGLAGGKSFEQALESRTFEPDAPNFTPRISGILKFEDGDFSYKMSILKSIDAEGSGCVRQSFSYPSKAGIGHFIHTYICDSKTVLLSFVGEPERVKIEDGIDKYTEKLWKSLDENNRISLYVRYTDLETLEYDDRTVNKNK